MIGAGVLDQRITIQQKITTRDLVGGEVNNWTTWATVWAAVIPIRGSEYVAHRQAQSDITTKFRIRYRPWLTTAMRIIHGSQVFDIREVIDPNSRHEYLELMCVAETVPT